MAMNLPAFPEDRLASATLRGGSQQHFLDPGQEFQCHYYLNQILPHLRVEIPSS